MDDSPSNPNGPPARVLQIIRFAMAAGVLAFAAVSTQVRKLPPEPPLEIGYVAAGFALFILLPLFFFQARARTLPSRGDRATCCLIGWALGEGAAMLGVVSYFIGNPPVWTLPGLAVLALALITFPIPED